MKTTDDFTRVHGPGLGDTPPIDKTENPVRVMGLSAGNGVILYPISKDPCFKLLGNVEVRPAYYYKKMPTQWMLNFPTTAFYPMVPPIENVEVIIGNPKCGAYSNFSNFQKKKESTPTGANEPSLALFINGVNTLKPKIFLMENLVKINEAVDLEEAFPDYDLHQIIGSVSMFGNSQLTRTRLVLVGVIKGFKRFSKHIEPFRVGSLKTTEELLADLPDNGHWEPPMEDKVQIYQGIKKTYQECKQYWKDHPYRYQWFMPHPKQEGKILTAPGVYRLKNFDFPLTVRASTKQFNPDLKEMSARELARIQGVPDEFMLIDDIIKPSYSDTKNKVTVCNTPPMEIAEWFRQVLHHLGDEGFFSAEPKFKKKRKLKKLKKRKK